MRSTGTLLAWSVVGVALLYTGSLPVTTNDLHIYLSMGRWMAEHGMLLENEAFTWTAEGTPFVNGTWGFSLAAFHLHEAIGLDGLRLFNGVAVALSVLFTMRACLSRGVDRRAAALAALVAWALVLQNTVVRGQTWVFPVFAALMWLGARPRHPLLALSAGILGGAVWASLHGSFGAGVAFFGLVGAGALLDGRPVRETATAWLIGLGIFLGACIGPYGPEIWLYVLDNSALPRERDFVEWYPADPNSFEGLRLLVVLGGWCVLGAVQERRRPLGDLLILLAFGYLALSGTRFIAWFGLATAPALALRISESMGPDRGNHLVRPLSLALGVAWVVFIARLVQPLSEPLHRDTPVDLVEALRTRGATRLFNAPEYGGYINWVSPEMKTSMDIRTWIFDDPTFESYVITSRAEEGWGAGLAGADGLLLLESFHGQTLIPAADESPCWTLLLRDDRGAAFGRTPGLLGCP